MIDIPAGKITLRDDRLNTSWTATISPFAMSSIPVSQEVYQSVMGVNPSGFQGASLPVENVSWMDATAFCRRYSKLYGGDYRLPSEAEWQYACQAGSSSIRYDESVYGSYRVFRGGGWNDEARSVMATTRRRSHPEAFKIDDLGFRIVRSPLKL